MRSVNEEVTFEESKEVTVIAVTEDLGSWHVYPYQKQVIVETNLKDENDNIIPTTTRNLIIDGENYDLLMAESPDFAPGKPANNFRTEDLFYVIDKVRREKEEFYNNVSST